MSPLYIYIYIYTYICGLILTGWCVHTEADREQLRSEDGSGHPDEGDLTLQAANNSDLFHSGTRLLE